MLAMYTTRRRLASTRWPTTSQSPPLIISQEKRRPKKSKMSTISSYFKPVATNIKKGETSGASPNIEKTKQKSQKTVNGKELSSEEESTIPWVEKYRPKKVDEVVCQEEVVAVLKKCVQGADLPNLLFYGPPGTGKTSAAVAMCHQLFRTATVYKDRVLEMNASDERGIDIVRNRIKEFARISISKQAKDALVPLKIVILDEADAMTGAAQSALRRTMESETQTTRFFLICNYITRIIEPLASRCAKFRFKPLSDEAQKKRLMLIAEKEQVKIDADALGQLVSISCGDLRKSITLLQSMACFGHGREINVEDVLEMSGQIPDEEFTSLLDAAGSLQQNKLLNCIKCLSRNGYSAIQFISQLADVINQNEQLKHGHKAKIFSRMAEAERRLIEGADEYLQLLELALTIRDCLMEAEVDE